MPCLGRARARPQPASGRLLRHCALPVSSAQPGSGLAPPGAWVTLAVVEPVSAEALGRGVGVSPEATGDACAAPPLPARLPTDGHGAKQRSLSLRVAAHGHRWHLG